MVVRQELWPESDPTMLWSWSPVFQAQVIRDSLQLQIVIKAETEASCLHEGEGQ